MNAKNKTSNLIRVSTLLAISVIVSSCNQAISRRDSISPNFGNAIAANMALQTIDPWPRNVENTHIHTDGTKAANAIELYQTPTGTESSSSSSIIEAAEIGPQS